MDMKSLSRTVIGNFECTAIETGRFMLDGGAMFGVVPKTLWSRAIPADEKNRIPMAMRCLLLRSSATGKIYLIDNGCGTKFDEKMSAIYALDYEHSNLERSLQQAGVKPEEITDIIFSHLHFDHCGGTTRYNSSGEIEHVFQNAVYHVNRRHWGTATSPNDREKASFLRDNIQPLAESDRLNRIDDNHEFEPGLKVMHSEGHTVAQQLPVITGNGKTLIFTADLLPTHAHVPLPWVMGYDMEPLKTLSEKKAFLERMANDGSYLFLEHDADCEIITISNEDGKYVPGKKLTLNEL
jgi:glyoxylase-like metal-dependent hydrolase (beta-lactamase superfamily II)